MSKVFFLCNESTKLRIRLIKIMINVDYITEDSEIQLLCLVRACIIYPDCKEAMAQPLQTVRRKGSETPREGVPADPPSGGWGRAGSSGNLSVIPPASHLHRFRSWDTVKRRSNHGSIKFWLNKILTPSDKAFLGWESLWSKEVSKECRLTLSDRPFGPGGVFKS